MLRSIYEHAIPDTRVDLSLRDTALYALSLGMIDEALPFVYEGTPGGLKALPAMGLVLADPGFWMRETALDLPKLVHLAERLELVRPIPPEGQMSRQTHIRHVADKGTARGALLVAESVLADMAGNTVARLRQTVMARGDGGSGEIHGTAPDSNSLKVPERAPDAVIDRRTLPQQALLYRWNGDLNPLHADPAVARKAGFDRPILHGLCTMGLASLAVMEAFCDWSPDVIAAMEARFSAPVFPGETLRCALWREGDQVILRASVLERDVVALNPANFSLKTRS